MLEWFYIVTLFTLFKKLTYTLCVYETILGSILCTKIIFNHLYYQLFVCFNHLFIEVPLSNFHEEFPISLKLYLSINTKAFAFFLSHVVYQLWRLPLQTLRILPLIASGSLWMMRVFGPSTRNQ